MKVAKVVLVFLVMLTAFISGCSRVVSFERIAGGLLDKTSDSIGGSYPGEDARIYVISSNQSLPAEALNWLHPWDEDKILQVDYSKNFVVVAFNGYRGGIWTTFYIQKIEQRGDVISVTAHFNDRNGAVINFPAESSQYQALKISRDQIRQSGLIIFKLLDESGAERARTTYELNSGG